ncbi:hypothetical protein FYL10_09725 [Lactobacillus salivarius]|uniref:Uncharacterized protein n=1 Tax=Ligilactobacillus salivarius TaxID=1624 RepID=A0ABD6J9S3_9LACO|nr:hypothetical protein [Ligilactobacillus salivarius]MYY21107.1 hypothetical protein [Ligilactobacillus salivarius]MYY73893.1 hypothetical protein [Ligilactobacillus salivarius]
MLGRLFLLLKTLCGLQNFVSSQILSYFLHILKNHFLKCYQLLTYFFFLIQKQAFVIPVFSEL